ncbi:hypothetical protein LguiB_020483 [Lonicera macranthoides]
MEWLSKWRFGNQMEAGDEIIVTFDCMDKYEIKDCGFNIVYRDQEDDNGTTTIENSHHDFPTFQLSSGAYFLCTIKEFLHEDYLPLKAYNDLEVRMGEPKKAMTIECGAESNGNMSKKGIQKFVVDQAPKEIDEEKCTPRHPLPLFQLHTTSHHSTSIHRHNTTTGLVVIALKKPTRYCTTEKTTVSRGINDCAA